MSECVPQPPSQEFQTARLLLSHLNLLTLDSVKAKPQARLGPDVSIAYYNFASSAWYDAVCISVVVEWPELVSERYIVFFIVEQNSQTGISNTAMSTASLILFVFYLCFFNRRDDVVVGASASQSVELGLIS